MHTIDDYKTFTQDYLDGVTIRNIVADCEDLNDTLVLKEIDNVEGLLSDYLVRLEDIMDEQGGYDKVKEKYPLFDKAWDSVEWLQSCVAECRNPTPMNESDYEPME